MAVLHQVQSFSNTVTDNHLMLVLQLVQPGPGVGTSGQIARIRLENFMCHDHLEMELT